MIVSSPNIGLLVAFAAFAVGCGEQAPLERHASRASTLEGAGVTVYFHGTEGKGALDRPDVNVIAPRWSTIEGAVTQATQQSYGSSLRAVAGYSLGRKPLVALLAGAAAASIDTVMLIDPLYDDGVTAAAAGRTHVLLICSEDARATASCGAMASALGVEPCRFAGDHLGLGAHIPDILRWTGGACPSGTTGPGAGTGASPPPWSEESPDPSTTPPHTKSPPATDPGASAYPGTGPDPGAGPCPGGNAGLHLGGGLDLGGGLYLGAGLYLGGNASPCPPAPGGSRDGYD